MSMIRRPPMRVVGMALLLAGVVFSAACTPSHPQSTFDTSGPVARSQLTLFYWIFWAAVFVFITVGGALLYEVIRFRRRPGDPDPEQIHGNTPIEIGWTLVPVVVLAVVAVPTVITIFDNANSPDPDGLLVEVVGHQWWWEFNYPQLYLKAANELHVPVDKVINIKLDSKDVLHSFWIPKLAGKVDVVPGNINKMWFLAEKVGLYNGQCAEFCGESHANMRFKVIAESQADFDAWVAAEKGPGVVPVEPLAVQGMELFEGDAQCWSCHKIDGSERAKGTKGPVLTHVASRRHIAAGLIDNSQANLRRWLSDPNEVKPGNIMARDAAVYNNPDKALSEPDISALVAYLQSLK